MEKGKFPNAGLLRAAGFGALTSLVLSLIGAAITAILISSERVGEQSVGLAGLCAVAVAAFAGCFVAARLSGSGCLPAAMLSAAAYSLALLGGGVLVFDGAFSASWQRAPVCLLAGAAAGFLGAGLKGGRKHGRAFRANREFVQKRRR